MEYWSAINSGKVFRKIDAEHFTLIVLLVADFNALSQIISNNKLTPNMNNSSSVPREIIGSRRSCSVINLCLAKKLIVGTLSTRNIRTVLTCPGTVNCYNRVIHPLATL